MNNFDKLFVTVRKLCDDQKHIAEVNSFEAIATETGIPLDKLPLYLNHLQQEGLIKYSMADKYIYVTSLGKKKELQQKE